MCVFWVLVGGGDKAKLRSGCVLQRWSHGTFPYAKQKNQCTIPTWSNIIVLFCCGIKHVGSWRFLFFFFFGHCHLYVRFAPLITPPQSKFRQKHCWFGACCARGTALSGLWPRHGQTFPGNFFLHTQLCKTQVIDAHTQKKKKKLNSEESAKKLRFVNLPFLCPHTLFSFFFFVCVCGVSENPARSGGVFEVFFSLRSQI